MKFKGPHRFRGWDYSNDAAYYVTIVTNNRQECFGNVLDKRMILSEIGLAARNCWYEIPEHFPFVRLGAFVVMPDHIHGIIIIDKLNRVTSAEAQNAGRMRPDIIEAMAGQIKYPGKMNFARGNKFGSQSQNLAAIVRGFKIGVTKQARLTNGNFAWQPRYNDRIIRNPTEFRRITGYIITNPLRWR